MSQFLLTASIPGAVFLFVLIKTGIRLIFPFAIFVIVGMIGMGLLVFGAPDPTVLDDTQFVITPISVVAPLLILTAAFGILLLGVVVIARWFSGEYNHGKIE